VHQIYIIASYSKSISNSDKDLLNGVNRMSVEAAMRIFELSKNFPKEERYSLTDQIRRSSRSVSSNIAEAWRERKYFCQ